MSNPMKPVRPIIIYSPHLSKQCNDKTIRLPPTYIGVTKDPGRHAPNTKPQPTVQSNVEYKITNGESKRRMTTKEKKEYKYKLKMQLKEERQKRKELKEMKEKEGKMLRKQRKREEKRKKRDGMNNNAKDENVEKKVALEKEDKKDKYYQLEINEKAIQEENEDKRSLQTPVLLSGPLSSCAIQHTLFQNPLSNDDHIQKKQKMLNEELNSHTTNVKFASDDALAKKWCGLIKDRLKIAELERKRDVSIRPMVYHIVPELWTRLRPIKTEPKTENESKNTNESNDTNQSIPYSFISLRKPSKKDTYHQLFLQYLYKTFPSMHISCGIKFGCDYLLYHTNRFHCHSFAGIRLLIPNDGIPVPDPYDVSGYVRGLNTANKLALLATVMQEEEEYRVVIVDLALEKIVLTEEELERHGTWKRHNKHLGGVRKDVGLSLDKQR